MSALPPPLAQLDICRCPRGSGQHTHASTLIKMLRIMKNFWILIGLLFTAQTAMAQQSFSALDGYIQIWGKHMDSALVAESHELKMKLNYETAEVEFRVAMKTFTGNCDSFNLLARARPELELIFKGKMNVPFLSTKDHPEQNFKIEGLLNLNGKERPVTFNAILRHLFSGTVACRLSANLSFLLSDFNPTLMQQGFDDHVEVKLNQTLMKRGNE